MRWETVHGQQGAALRGFSVKVDSKNLRKEWTGVGVSIISWAFHLEIKILEERVESHKI